MSMLRQALRTCRKSGYIFYPGPFLTVDGRDEH